MDKIEEAVGEAAGPENPSGVQVCYPEPAEIDVHDLRGQVLLDHVPFRLVQLAHRLLLACPVPLVAEFRMRGAELFLAGLGEREALRCGAQRRRMRKPPR